jgi:hypothetical protein
MLHEKRKRCDDYASSRSLRGEFTGESWDVGDNKGYAALKCQFSAILTGFFFTYFDDSDNDDFQPLRVEDERRVYKGDGGCKNAS